MSMIGALANAIKDLADGKGMSTVLLTVYFQEPEKDKAEIRHSAAGFHGTLGEIELLELVLEKLKAVSKTEAPANE